MQTKVYPTLVNNYTNGDREFVFVVKSRPFACLVSPHLPTPTTSLIDYDLVSSLGLKMADLKCQKFFFGGHKMRILGKVSLTVQTIQDGLSSGTFHIKANVVTNLTKNLDTDCVAGSKTKIQLSATAPSPPIPSTPSTPSSARTSPPPTPARTPSTPGCCSPSRRRRPASPACPLCSPPA